MNILCWVLGLFALLEFIVICCKDNSEVNKCLDCPLKNKLRNRLNFRENFFYSPNFPMLNIYRNSEIKQRIYEKVNFEIQEKEQELSFLRFRFGDCEDLYEKSIENQSYIRGLLKIYDILNCIN